MAREEREQRAPRPERDHPVSKLAYSCIALVGNVLMAGDAEEKELSKQLLVKRLANAAKQAEAM